MMRVVIRALAAGAALLWGVTLSTSGGSLEPFVGAALLMGVPWITADAAALHVSAIILRGRALALEREERERQAELDRASADVPSERTVS